MSDFKITIPPKSRRDVVTCPLVSQNRELVTLKSCMECRFHVRVEEGDGDAHHYVSCVYPRMVPVREVRGE